VNDTLDGRCPPTISAGADEQGKSYNSSQAKGLSRRGLPLADRGRESRRIDQLASGRRLQQLSRPRREVVRPLARRAQAFGEIGALELDFVADEIGLRRIDLRVGAQRVGVVQSQDVRIVLGAKAAGRAQVDDDSAVRNVIDRERFGRSRVGTTAHAQVDARRVGDVGGEGFEIDRLLGGVEIGGAYGGRGCAPVFQQFSEEAGPEITAAARGGGGRESLARIKERDRPPRARGVAVRRRPDHRERSPAQSRSEIEVVAELLRNERVEMAAALPARRLVPAVFSLRALEPQRTKRNR
jgi:hypothetical protein